MIENFLHYWRELIIFLLSVILILAGLKIKQLKAFLNEEKKKRTLPILTLVKNKQKSRVDIINESYCYAKNVELTQTGITVDYGFPVRLILKFKNIESLKPNARQQIEFQVLNKDGHDISDEKSKNVLYLYADDSFDLNINFENLEGAKFISKIGCKSKEFYLKEIAA